MGPTATRTFDLGDESVTGERLWDASFVDSADWLVELQEPDTSEVSFDDGHMRIQCTGGGGNGVTVWTRQEFPADVVFEFTASMRETGDSEPTSRNLNCFFRARETPGQALDETTRSGAYPDYHDWDNYIFTLTRTHTRLRRDPGFEMVSDLALGAQPDVEYTVRIAAVGDRVQATVNDRLLHDWRDPEPHGSGWIGMRTYNTDVTYTDWTVYGVQ
ncbi:DUF6250 domain-containing protein [Haloarchaeobius sp. TZWSO28]|uniref:DUF6250 domain-containing protein n=1 Tax=Haloarchaeobius sp. TZWSO28 TaxID=3446119 RepID=UPI003EBEDEBD